MLAGYVTDLYGSGIAFLGLAAVAGFGLGVIALLMPETRRVAPEMVQADIALR